METKLWENVVAYIIDFLIVYFISVLVFKVITLHICCPLESNELTVYVESSSCLDSGQWSHILKSFGSTQIEQIPGLHSVFSRCLANTSHSQRENSCAWLFPAIKEIGNIQL